MTSRFHQWQLVKFATIFIATVFAFILLINGINEASFRMAIRFTARSSCVLFLLAFTASAWHRLRQNTASNWLLQNRRYFGLSMAISHLFHALAIAGVAVITSENMVRDHHLATIGYGFILLMALTSFQRPAAILGQRNWRILHSVGMYYLWLSFTFAFVQRINESRLIYLPFVITLILGLAMRLATVSKKYS